MRLIHKVLPRLCTQHATRYTGYPHALWITALGFAEMGSRVALFPTYFHRFVVPLRTCDIAPNESSVLLETLGVGHEAETLGTRNA